MKKFSVFSIFLIVVVLLLISITDSNMSYTQVFIYQYNQNINGVDIIGRAYCEPTISFLP